MRRILFMATATAFTLSISGCGFINSLLGGEETPVGEASPTESPVVVSPLPEETPGEQPAGETPPETPTATLPSDLDLIPSTNPEQRLQAIESERNDPFSLVPTTPSVQLPPPTERAQAPTTPPAGGGQAGGQATGRTPGQAPGGRGASAQAPTNRGGGQAPGGLAPIPNLVPQRTSPTVATRPSPPPPPQPNLARAVEVLGVVQVGNTRYAIVNAPNEPSSRYVREGQQLSNGQVVVRRIEVNGPEPVVVFEQYGIEVITAVGGGGSPEPAATSPAAAVPAASDRQPG